jgi:hypothetical protein
MPTLPRVGVLGLEARHEWENMGVVLNEPRAWGYPRYKLRRIGGLHSSPEADDNRDDRQGQLGQRARPSLVRGKTITYEGTVEALTLPDLRAACNDLRYVFGERRWEGRMNVLPDPSAVLGMPMWFRARATSLEIDDEQTLDERHVPSPWCRDFVLSLRMGDPRFYEWEEQTVSQDIHDGQASVSIEHPGSAPTDPVIYVHGSTGPDWTLTGHHDYKFVVYDQSVTAPDSAIVDFRERRITSGGNDWTGRANAESDWWNEGVDGIPARSTHDITLRSTSGGLTVTWYVAHY